MTIRHLRIFVAVAETKKMSAAAERCYISQPTVSQAIRELEEHYQVRLFERFSKKLHITEAGEQLLRYAYTVLSQFDLLESNMSEYHAQNQIRLGATMTVGGCLFSNVLNDLRQLYPDLQTYSYIANTATIEKMLLDSELDVGLVEGKISSPFLVTIPVVDDFLVLAMAQDHPLASREEITLQDLSSCEFVLRERGSGTRQLFESYLMDHNIPFKLAMEATCLDAIKNAVLYNGYVTAISVRFLEPEIRRQQIHIVRNLTSDWNRSFYLVYHKDKYVSPPMNSLRDIMAGYKCPEFLMDARTGFLSAG